MMVFFDKKLVLLSIPKTGTTALESRLGPQADIVFRHPTWLKHMGIKRFNRKYRKEIFGEGAQVISAAVMRDPVDWLGSWFRYRQRPWLDGKPNSTKGMTFEDFVSAYCREDRPPFADVGSQSGSLSNGQGKLAVRHVFDYARLGEYFDWLAGHLGPFDLPDRQNVSPPAPLDLSDAARGRLQQVIAADFALYDRVRAGQTR